MFVTGLCEVIPRWRFGVETARWQSLQFRLVKLIAVSDMPCAGDYSRNPVVTMGVGGDARMCRDAKHDGIYPCLVWIALQNDGLDSPYASASRARIGLWRKIVLYRSDSFLVCAAVSTVCTCMPNQRTIKEFTNQRDCVSWSFSLPPFPCARHDLLLHVRRYMPH